MSERASETIAVIGTIDPQKITAAGSVTGDVIDAKLFSHVMFVAMVGDVSSCSGDVTFKLYEGASATATKVTTTVKTSKHSGTSTGDNNYQWVFDYNTSNMGSNRYLKPVMTYAGGTGVYVGMAALGFKPRYHPASDNDLSSVTVVNCT